MRLFALTLTLPLLFSASPAPQKPEATPAGPVPTTLIAPLEQIARQLAKGAREHEMNDLLTAIEELGYPAAKMAKLREGCKDDLSKAKRFIDSLPAGSKQLRATSKQLVAVMSKLEDEPKLALARTILRLDGENAEAHAALGHEKVGTNWVPSEQKELRERRGEIFAAVQEAKKLAVEMEEGEVEDPVIQAACAVKATFARFGPFEVRSNFSQEKTSRILREAMRALAVSTYLMKGNLDLPKPEPGKPLREMFVMIDSREIYKAYAAECAKNGEMPAESAAIIDGLGSFRHKNGSYVIMAQWEGSTEAALLLLATQHILRLRTDGIVTPLSAGHLNWVTLTCLATLLPGVTVSESSAPQLGTTTVEGSEDEKREREERQRLAKSGIAGSRSWMAYLAERGEDPPLANSFVDQIGLLTGDSLHKWTSIIDYMQEAGMLETAYPKLARAKPSAKLIEEYANALGMSVGELEGKWRRWIIGIRPGVAERIDKEDPDAWPREALEVLEYMNTLRDNAFRNRVEGAWKLKFDPELSSQCALHAKYLELHPEQKKWPDAHEEYADKEGYTVEGAWAGTHSVIIWGDVADYIEAVDGWMGTFYHRLPLIDPGLLRIGWGWQGEFAVMDSGSLAGPYEKEFVVVWPYDGQRDVPVDFLGDEHPDPVPEGEPGSVVEQGKFGYPVTLQTNPVDVRDGSVVDIELVLWDTKNDKEPVPCHLSTPQNPTNPESAPGGAWCLIPKDPLKPKTEYRVVASWKKGSNQQNTAVARTMEWKFKTQ